MSKTIVFIHGAWMTPLCWDKFSDYFTAKGFTCHAPAWPQMDRPVAELRSDPPPELGKLGISEIVAHYEQFIRNLPEAPVIIGHSFGGLITQLLMDRGLGSAAVGISPVGPKGVLPFYPSAIRATLPILLTPFGWNRFIPQTFEGFRYGFVQNLPEAEARKVYETYCVPAVGRIFFQAATALFHNILKVDFANAKRAPLLLIAGSEDHAVPEAEVRVNLSRYQRHPAAAALTDFKTFGGRMHYLIGQPGWEEIAGYIERWLESRGVVK
ncbi:MAG: alpha/beta hydrolase [Anaerolineae bacterium]